MNDKLRSARTDYVKHVLLEEDAGDNPFVLFGQWLNEAEQADPAHFNAFTLATVGPEGCPHARIVLLRSFNGEGFQFFTNYESNKGRELTHEPLACLNFFWSGLERQVRIYGRSEKLSAAESDEYFASRPRESQIGAWASQQSKVLETREELEQRIADLISKYEGKTIPRPPFWGGFLIRPYHFEFWQGRASRLHDRLVYIQEDGKPDWTRTRLSP
jgi:pyridoxamine 5'-phosphate oxidase